MDRSGVFQPLASFCVERQLFDGMFNGDIETQKGFFNIPMKRHTFN